MNFIKSLLFICWQYPLWARPVFRAASGHQASIQHLPVAVRRKVKGSGTSTRAGISSGLGVMFLERIRRTATPTSDFLIGKKIILSAPVVSD